MLCKAPEGEQNSSLGSFRFFHSQSQVHQSLTFFFSRQLNLT